MGQIVPDLVEQYLSRLNHARTRVLDDVAQSGANDDLPLIDAEVGALLQVLAAAIGARRILEVGTCIGYSGIWLAGALPDDGMLITMEKDPERARIAKENFERAGVSNRVSVMVGDAQLKLVKLAGPFDLIFQDGAKPLYNTMLDPLIELLRPGGLLVTDNVLWDGEVVPGYVETPQRKEEDTRAISEYNERISNHPSLITSIVPLRDGVAISMKRKDASH
jgi:predicted O-methyltransferase YrrM